MAPPSWRINIDTGGTFTDACALPPDSADLVFLKVLSSSQLRLRIIEHLAPGCLRVEVPGQWNTPDQFFVGFQVNESDRSDPIQVIQWQSHCQTLTLSHALPDSPQTLDLTSGEEAPVLATRLLTGTALGEIFPTIHLRLATTRGTNALLENKVASTAFFTTRGFGDLLTIRDQRRPDLFALRHQVPPPLHQSCIEIDERLDARGEILQAFKPDDPEFQRACQQALASGITVAAAALLHSYLNPEHEQQLRDYLLKIGFQHVSLSSDLAPLIRLLPRANTTVVDACLTPVMQSFIDNISRSLENCELLIMTSAGGLENARQFHPKDSLFSGPAGGVVGAASAARRLSHDKIISFDMGGTSTDVARYDGDFLYQFEQKAGGASLLAPSLRIETVAAGGGSICHFTEAGLQVGPESAGSYPGPACYGNGGPLTITDVNLLLGRIDPYHFGIPLTQENIKAARQALSELRQQSQTADTVCNQSFLEGLLAIAIEQMADAIHTISVREGVNPKDYTLLAFGGAGPLHACNIAEQLGCQTILVPPEAGLLSAYGLHHASIEHFAEIQVSKNLSYMLGRIPQMLEELIQQASQKLIEQLTGQSPSGIHVRRKIAELRLAGQDASLSLEITNPELLAQQFRKLYHKVFAYAPDPEAAIELTTLRVIVFLPGQKTSNQSSSSNPPVIPFSTDQTFINRTELKPGMQLRGPAVIQDSFSTCYLKKNWRCQIASDFSLLLSPISNTAPTSSSSSISDSSIQDALFRNRFENIVSEMGAQLQRSSVSTNVKERQDFSCALLDSEANLVVNAPHIPVHLGALGLCVREVIKQQTLRPGDTIITNHPAFGGSHLPDVTLITAIFDPNAKPDEADRPIAYIANRAHHAEIGGITPGSMPPNARTLAQEGVVISPTLLINQGQSCFDSIKNLLCDSNHPTRHLADNLADLNAQLAANHQGLTSMQNLIICHGANTIRLHLEKIARLSQATLQESLRSSPLTQSSVCQSLDDGTKIIITGTVAKTDRYKLILDFTGTSLSHPGNLNATPAIVRSAVLYVLRLWTQSELPLNEGLLRDVELILPTCFLNPDFPADPGQCPAVVGGNVESSQRLVDTLLLLFGIQACSQGSMNNLIFGDDSFGYYETIGGGAGAGPDYDGASGLHSHMTNTAITDPEILEQRYPVRLHRFALRKNSGGQGQHRGGDGLIREFEFLRPLKLSLITQHRLESPYGIKGGEGGKCGQQTLIKSNGEQQKLPPITEIQTKPGDRLIIKTPGGGAWGKV